MNSTVSITSFINISVTLTTAANRGPPPGFPQPGVYTDVKEWLWKIIPPIVMLLGTFGNSLTIIVLLRQIKNLSSTAVYLLSLAFSDLLVLYMGPLRQWIKYLWKTDVRSLTNAGCKIQIFLTYFSIMFSSWLLVAVTVERAVSVILPHKVKLCCTTMKASITVMIIFVGVFGLNSHLFYGYGLVHVPSTSSPYRCTTLYDHYKDFRSDILPWLDFTFTFLVPFVLLTVCNVIIIVTLGKNARRRRKMSITASDKKNRSVTILLIILCIVYFICLTPISLYLIILPYAIEEANELPFLEMIRQREYLQFWHALANCFMYINSSTNFILYFLSGSRFRSEVKALFTCKHAGKECVFGNSTTTSKSSLGTDINTVTSTISSMTISTTCDISHENNVIGTEMETRTIADTGELENDATKEIDGYKQDESENISNIKSSNEVEVETVLPESNHQEINGYGEGIDEDLSNINLYEKVDGDMDSLETSRV